MITAAVETLDECLEDIRRLLPAHWEELALFRDRMPLDPQWEVYRAREVAGQFLMVVLRRHGEVIGYYCGVIAPGLHYASTLTFTTDIFWIAPEHRGAGIGSVLLRTLERELRRRGVRLAWMGSKNHKPSEFLFQAHGYAPAETYFCKWLED